MHSLSGTARGLNPGPFDPKSDMLTTSPPDLYYFGLYSVSRHHTIGMSLQSTRPQSTRNPYCNPNPDTKPDTKTTLTYPKP